MVNNLQRILGLRRLGLTIILALTMIAASLAVLQLNAYARHGGSGAGGCLNFDVAVDTVKDGDTIAQMIPEKDSFGVTITENIVIQGGWNTGTSGGCAGQGEVVYTDATAMLNAGFIIEAPEKRSELIWDMGPVITIDPQVVTLTIQHMSFRNDGAITQKGGGIFGVIDNGAQVRLENVLLTDSTTISNGGGLYLEVRGGSRLVISDSQFIGNTSGAGGGFEIHVFDNSQVIIHNTKVFSNNANTGNGGGGRLVIASGVVSITDSAFSGNQAPGGSGSDLSIESTGGPATVWLRNTTFANTPSETGAGLTVFDQHTYLPVTFKNGLRLARISNITSSGANYVVDFQTVNFTPQLPGQHLHFFYNTVPPEQAGVPGSGPWFVYGGASPFSGATIASRPAGATQMCVLVANENHTVQNGTGNCFPLP